MRQSSDNRNHGSCANPHGDAEARALRLMLDSTEPADLFDRDARERVGKAIALAVFDPEVLVRFRNSGPF